MGYLFKTLYKALGQPGVTIHNLLPASTPVPNDAHLQKAGLGPSSIDDLPEYSPLTLAYFLVRFIVADDQVHITFIWELEVHEYMLTFFAVY